MMRLAQSAGIALAIGIMFVAYVIWPALLADGVAVENLDHAYCLKHAQTGEEIRQCS
jgi:hypothetical protein